MYALNKFVLSNYIRITLELNDLILHEKSSSPQDIAYNCNAVFKQLMGM